MAYRPSRDGDKEEFICKRHSESPRGYLRLGDVCAKAGKKEKMVVAYLRVLRLYAKQGFNLKAVAVAKQILKAEPNLIPVYRILVNLYKQLGLLADALRTQEDIDICSRRLASCEIKDSKLVILGDGVAEAIFKEMYPEG